MFYFSLNAMLMKWKSVLLNVVEIAIILYLGVIIISTYFLQSRKYEPYRKLLKSQGVRVYFGEGEQEEKISLLSKVESIHYTVTFSVYANGVSSSQFRLRGMDEMMAAYKPDMEDGIWFADYRGKEPLAVTVTENPYGIKTGDYVDIFIDGENGPEYVSAYVSGVFRNGEEYVDGNTYKHPGSIQDYYFPYNSETVPADKENPLIFMNLEDAERLRSNCMEMGVYIEYAPDITDEEIKANEDILTETASINTFEELRKNSLEIITKKIAVITPIAVGALLFVTMSVICSSAIDTSRELKNYAIFFIHGMKWRDIVRIKLIEAVTEGLLSLAVMYIISRLVNAAVLGKNIVFEMGRIQLLYCFGIIIYMAAVSVIVPAAIVNKSKPAGVLRDAEV